MIIAVTLQPSLFSGGRFRDIAIEIDDCKIAEECQPKVVVLLCGTNDMSRHFRLDEAERQFAGMLLTAKERFQSAKVCIPQKSRI